VIGACYLARVRELERSRFSISPSDDDGATSGGGS